MSASAQYGTHQLGCLLIMIATFQCLLVLSIVHITWLLTDYDCYLPMSACAQYSTHQLGC